MKACSIRSQRFWPLAWALAAVQAVAASHTQEARDWANRQAQEDQRQRQEQFDPEKKASGKAITDFGAGGAATPSASSGNALRDRVVQLRAHALRLPALPPDRNPLLGRWKRVKAPGGASRDPLQQMFAAVNEGPCGMLMGEAIEFRAGEWFGIDASGTDSLGSAQYRMEGRKLYVIPSGGGVQLMVFDWLSNDRIQEALVGGNCELVRAAGGGATAARAPSTAIRTTQQAATAPLSGSVIDGAAFRCADGGLYHVTGCRGDVCDVTEWRLPTVNRFPPMSVKPVAQIAEQVKACEAGGIRYGADNKPVFVR